MVRKHPSPVGAYVSSEMLDYIDKLIETRGFLSRSDCLRVIIGEHQQLFSPEIGRKAVLTSFKKPVNVNGQTEQDNGA